MSVSSNDSAEDLEADIRTFRAALSDEDPGIPRGECCVIEICPRPSNANPRTGR
jgi:hypothetical protein